MSFMLWNEIFPAAAMAEPLKGATWLHTSLSARFDASFACTMQAFCLFQASQPNIMHAVSDPCIYAAAGSLQQDRVSRVLFLMLFCN
jgi:hypothetical protein